MSAFGPPAATGIDRERVERRLAFIQEEVRALRELLAEQTYLADPLRATIHPQDPWKRRGVRYAVQTAIEAVCDVAYHICAKRFRHAPADPHDAVERLAQEGVIAPELLPKLHGMIGLRNRLVHGYLDIDDRRLVELLKEGLGDFDAYVGAIRKLLGSSSAQAR